MIDGCDRGITGDEDTMNSSQLKIKNLRSVYENELSIYYTMEMVI